MRSGPPSARSLPTPGPSRQRRLALAGLAGLPLGLWGCQQPEPPLRVGSITFPGYELMFAARELGWLPSENVRLIELTSSVDVTRALALGHLDAANLTLDELLTARAEGQDLRVLLVLDISAGADAVIGRATLKQPRDLIGKRIGVEVGAVGAVLLSTMLQQHGMHAGQIQRVPVTLTDSAAAFEAGQLDAVVTCEPWASQLEARGARRLFDSRAAPGLIVDVFVARAEVITTRPTDLRAVIGAHFKALGQLQTRPDRVLPLMGPRLGLNAEELKRAFIGLELPDLERNRQLLSDPTALHRSAETLQTFMRAQALLPQPAGLERLIDASLLPT